MVKSDLVKILCNNLQECKIIKCIFCDEESNDDNSSIINLYLLINEADFYIVEKDVEKSLDVINGELMFQKSIYNENYSVLSFYFDNLININYNFVYNYEFKIINKIICLYDPYNLFFNFKSIPLPYTNKEYAKLIDDFCIYLYDFFDMNMQNDKMQSYLFALEIQKIFIKIYRGFYDSLNAKKTYKNLMLLTEKHQKNLLSIIKLYKYDTFIDAVQLSLNEVDKIINSLPINVISLFNFDFYTFNKKNIYSL